MDENILENIYKEKLDERIIAYIAKKKSISLERAMKIYYNSELSDKIYHGIEGIQYLDHKVLVQILEETEEEKFIQ